jgi:protein required for attachment to host cells
MADRPGRTFDSAGHGRHAMEPPTDPKRVEQHAFFTEVAERLEAAARGGKFDRLVLVAEPRALGELRRLLAPAVAAKVSAELDKDLTHLPPAEIGERLGGVLAV